MRAKLQAFQDAFASLKKWRQQRIFRDRLSLGMAVGSLALNGATFLILLFNLEPTNIPVPIHYTSFGGFDRLGHWYQIYNIALFGLLATVVNFGLATLSFNRSRITSFFLLAGAFVVSLFCLIIGTAFSLVI